MPISDDEYTCLMIMQSGENLIRMKNTRWYQPLTDLHLAGLVDPIGNENFVINAKGRYAISERDGTPVGRHPSVEADVRHELTASSVIQRKQQEIHGHMRAAINAVVLAARIGAGVTGSTPLQEARKIAEEIGKRVIQELDQ